MEYRAFGNTGMKLSRLGFGAMRLPMTTVDRKEVVDDDLAIPMIHRAFEQGVNYIDSAFMYCADLSEVTVGKALKGWREKVCLSTKFPTHRTSLRETLEIQLTKLDTDRIDVYHFHGIGHAFLEHERRDQWIKEAQQAKDEGLIGHIAFSFHDRPEVMPSIMDLGIFESVLCQYNLLDRSNEGMLAEAKARGLRTVVMGPVGGGRISGLPAAVAKQLGITTHSSAELALRFVLANPNVDTAISGMSTMAQVVENVAIANNTSPLTEDEVAGINAAMAENKRLAELYCTGCRYCTPHCPQEVNIPHIFQAMIYHKVYGITDHSQHMYDEIGMNRWVHGKRADACIECGECEEYCPQHIEIRKQLKECVELFGGKG